MNYRVYQVNKNDEMFCNDYDVYVDGKHVELNTARVSREPFNRRWPGHQRQLEQTELVNFLSMSISEKVNFKIYPRIPFQKVEIRPKRLGIIPEINEDGSIEFCLTKPACFTIEPYGRHSALHVFADKDEQYYVDKKNEDVLYFGAGEHDLEYFDMKDNQTLFIDEGAVVYATINAFNVNNIRIIGHGILDNSKNKEKIIFETNSGDGQRDVGNAERKYMIEIDCCKNVEIDGITIRDPLVYNINCCSCKNVRINNVKVIGDWRFNSDGIHFANCIDCSLTNSFLRTYDDSVVVRGYTYKELDRCNKVDNYLTDCKNITIHDNVIWNDWGTGIRIGAATLSDDICDITYKDNCIIHTTTCSIDFYQVDYAKVHDFVFNDTYIELDEIQMECRIQKQDDEHYTDIAFDKNYVPELIQLKIFRHFEYSNVQATPDWVAGQLYNVVFRNTRIYGRHKIVFTFNGYDERHKIENIVFDGVYKNDKKLNDRDIKIVKNEFTGNITIVKN